MTPFASYEALFVRLSELAYASVYRGHIPTGWLYDQFELRSLN